MSWRKASFKTTESKFGARLRARSRHSWTARLHPTMVNESHMIELNHHSNTRLSSNLTQWIRVHLEEDSVQNVFAQSLVEESKRGETDAIHDTKTCVSSLSPNSHIKTETTDFSSRVIPQWLSPGVCPPRQRRLLPNVSPIRLLAISAAPTQAR